MFSEAGNLKIGLYGKGLRKLKDMLFPIFRIFAKSYLHVETIKIINALPLLYLEVHWLLIVAGDLA